MFRGDNFYVLVLPDAVSCAHSGEIVQWDASSNYFVY